MLVARVEALISGRSMDEALERAAAYHAAGADAILIHSKQSSAQEILAFAEQWDGRAPLVIVPTMYYATPTEVFERIGISTIIWANHLLRSSMTAMQATARKICQERSLIEVEDRVASVKDVFRLVGNAELEAAEKRYLPRRATPSAVVLAASQGNLDNDAAPKCMADIRGRPLLSRLAETLERSGIRDVTVVRGFAGEAVNLPGLKYVDNDDYAKTGELYSLDRARERLSGETIIVYGDTLFRRFILDTLLDTEGDIVLAVDGRSRPEPDGTRRVRDLVVAERPSGLDWLGEAPARLKAIGPDTDAAQATGEWIGVARFSATGAALLREELDLARSEGRLASADLPSVLARIAARHPVYVHYFDGHWIDVDNLGDLAAARNFT